MARKIGSRYTAHQILGRGSAGTVWLGEGPEGPSPSSCCARTSRPTRSSSERFVQERTRPARPRPPARGRRPRPRRRRQRPRARHGPGPRHGPAHPPRARPPARAARRRSRSSPTSPTGWPPRTPRASCTATSSRRTSCSTCRAPLGPGGAHPALLTDFGVAKLIDSPRRTTRATSIIGTPDYLAPEIVEGLPPRASVDIYALATVLYELLAGFTPFGGGHPGAVLRRHVTETVAPLPGIPDELWQLIVQCLAKAPASRLRAVGAGGAAAGAAADPGGHPAAGRRRAVDERTSL